jgi:acetyl-CoA C-acetyltransferase/acetyl-CoA acyltransferase
MRSFIISSSAVKIDRYYDKNFKELAIESIKDLEKKISEPLEPEALIISSVAVEHLDRQSNMAGIIADYLGLRNIRVYRVESGEASGLAAVQIAHSLVSSKAVKKALVIGVDKLSDMPNAKIAELYSYLKDSDYIQIHGVSPLSEAALLAKIYMKTYDYSYEDLFIWPFTMHQNSLDTPHAQLRFKISPDSYKESPILAEPLRLLDSYPFGDGASALYIVSEDVAEEYDVNVSIEGLSSSNDVNDIASREDLLIFSAVRDSFIKTLKMADIELGKLKYIEIHDNYTPNAFIVLESIGLADRGKAPELLQDSMIGSAHVNLSGGLKARGNPWGATGIYQVHEIFSALLGEFKKSVLGEIDYAAAQNMSGCGDVSYSIVLKRVR